MFVVATATFELLYAVIVLNQHRRRAIHFEVTQNPSHVWLARQITEAFPWDTAPCCYETEIRLMVLAFVSERWKLRKS
jgi:hypothetical protein